MALRVVTASTETLISLEVAKAQLRVDYADDDGFIADCIRTATDMVQASTQRRYLTQTLEWVRPLWCAPMRLPVAPVASVTWVKYTDLDGVQQTLDPSLYWAAPDGEGVAIRPRRFAIWPLLGDAAEPVVIRFIAGAAASALSPGVAAAAKLLVSHLYQNRDAVLVTPGAATLAELPMAVEALLAAERWT